MHTTAIASSRDAENAVYRLTQEAAAATKAAAAAAAAEAAAAAAAAYGRNAPNATL